MRSQLAERAKKDLDKGRVWAFKMFTLFPVLEYMRYFDFGARWIFPVAYLVFVTGMLDEVGYGTGHFNLLNSAPCYQAAI